MSATQPQSTLQQNKHLVLRWFEEVWNQGRRETIAELLAPEGVIYDGAKAYRGPAGFTVFYDTLRSQFSDFSVKPIISLAEGDLACLHWSVDCRHTESGTPTHVTGMSIVRVKDGQVIEAWQNWDAAGLAAQLPGKPTISLA